MGRPAIMRMTPKLTIFRETIGRNASENFGAPTAIKPEEFRIRHHISAFQSHEHRDVAQQFHSHCRTSFAKSCPLFVEFKLQKSVIATCVIGECAPTFQPRCFALLKGSKGGATKSATKSEVFECPEKCWLFRHSCGVIISLRM